MKKFTRESLIKSGRYSDIQADFLHALLKKDEYTLTEADKIIEKFRGKEVK